MFGAVFSNAFKISRKFVDMWQANVFLFQNFPGSAGSCHLLSLFISHTKKKKKETKWFNFFFPVFKRKTDLKLLENFRSLCFRVPELL